MINSGRRNFASVSCSAHPADADEVSAAAESPPCCRRGGDMASSTFSTAARLSKLHTRSRLVVCLRPKFPNKTKQKSETAGLGWLEERRYPSIFKPEKLTQGSVDRSPSAETQNKLGVDVSGPQASSARSCFECFSVGRHKTA